MSTTVSQNGTAVVTMAGPVLIGSGDNASLGYSVAANTCTLTLDAMGNGSCVLRGYADNGAAFTGYAMVSNSNSVVGVATITGALCR